MSRHLSICAAAVSCVLALGAPRSSSRFMSRLQATDDSSVARLVTQRVEGRLAAGMVVGIIDAHGERHVYAAGRSRDDGPPVSANTVFEIGSITKTFTASLLADMVQRGEVALDDPVNKYLPPTAQLAPNGRAITLLDLATQSSGLPSLPSNFRPANPDDPYADYDGAHLEAFLNGYKPPRPPGEQYEYSNLGVGLLGYALSRRAGTSYEKLLETRILRPLGMTDTRITLTPEMRRRLAEGHNRDGDDVENWSLDALAGAGAIRSTVDDMLKYLAANMDSASKPLGPVLHFAQRDRRPAGSANMTIGLNWHRLHENGTEIVWHNGETAGYHSFLGFDPVRRVGVVILSNSATANDDLGFHLVDERSPLRPPPPPPEAAAQEASLLDSWVGSYALAPAVTLNVTRAGGKLYLRLTGQQRFRLFPTSDSTYRIPAVSAELEFHRGTDGKAREVVLHQGGRDTPAPRVP